MFIFRRLRVTGGIGYSLQDWLDKLALPEEANMADEAHARVVAREFIHGLVSHGTTTALVFGAHFAEATAELFDAAERRGLRVISGLVLSDRSLNPVLHQTPDVGATRASKERNPFDRTRYHGKNRLELCGDSALRRIGQASRCWKCARRCCAKIRCSHSPRISMRARRKIKKKWRGSFRRRK